MSGIENIGPIIKKKCYVKKGFLPNITPVIYNLSTYESQAGKYKIVYVTGENFNFNTTSVTFGSMKNIQVVYYDSFNISFVIPINYTTGIYNVQVTVVNNRNMLVPNTLYSNSLMYILT